jgi:hypothetical protein
MTPSELYRFCGVEQLDDQVNVKTETIKTQ